MCIKDSTSSAGGRCVLSGDEVAFERPQLGLEECPEDNQKCYGRFACYNADYDMIGCGSCNGASACVGMAYYIGEKSCNGERACYNILGSVGDGSW